MRNQKLLCAAVFILLASSSVHADNVTETAAEGYENLYKNADITAAKLIDIKSAALNYFAKNNVWPTDETVLVADGFYFGTYDTMYGTSINGHDNGDSYSLEIDVLEKSVAQYISAYLNGTTTGTVVTVEFGLPSEAALLESTLSRVYDGDVSRNTMETDIYMGGNDILGIGRIEVEQASVDLANINVANINTVNAQIINSPLATITTLNSDTVNTKRLNATAGVYDNGVRVFSPVNLPTKDDVGLNLIENYAMTDSYTGNSSNLYASQRAVTSAYNTLNNSKLDRNAKAIDAELLDGINSTQFMRSDIDDNIYANTEWQDNKQVRLGSSADMRLYHNGTNSHIDNYTGDVYIRNLKAGKDIYLEATTSGGTRHAAIKVDAGGEVGVSLNHNGSTKLYTSTSGIKINGNIDVSGHLMVSGKKISKEYVDLAKVMNYSISDSYTGGSSNLYASQKAVTNAYNTLNNSKLGKSDKAADSEKLDGLDSSAFVRTSRRINGHALTADINLDKSDIGLPNVANYGITNSYTGDSTTKYVSQRALNNAYKAALSGGTAKFTTLFESTSGIGYGDVHLLRSWRGYDEIFIVGSHDSKRDIYTKTFTEAEYDRALDVYLNFGRSKSELRFHLISDRSVYWAGYFSSDTKFITTAETDAVMYGIYGVTMQ